MAIVHITKNDLTANQLELVLAARTVMANSYNVYSHFYVGAAVRSQSGRIYAGTNMENASYGMTICAEPAALMAAFSAGEPKIIEMAIIGAPQPDGVGGKVATPCGRCRQLIHETSEIAGLDIPILCSNGDLSDILLAPISDLLPYPFGPKDLGYESELANYLHRLEHRN